MYLVSRLLFNFFDVIHLTGETAAVVVNISNRSSTKMRPKVKLQECVEYRAGSRTTTSSRIWGKLVGDTVKGNSEETFNFQVKIPGEIIPSILNCEIISVEYKLKVPIVITMSPLSDSMACLHHFLMFSVWCCVLATC